VEGHIEWPGPTWSKASEILLIPMSNRLRTRKNEFLWWFPVFLCRIRFFLRCFWIFLSDFPHWGWCGVGHQKKDSYFLPKFEHLINQPGHILHLSQILTHHLNSYSRKGDPDIQKKSKICEKPRFSFFIKKSLCKCIQVAKNMQKPKTHFLGRLAEVS